MPSSPTAHSGSSKPSADAKPVERPRLQEIANKPAPRVPAGTAGKPAPPAKEAPPNPAHADRKPPTPQPKAIKQAPAPVTYVKAAVAPEPAPDRAPKSKAIKATTKQTDPPAEITMSGIVASAIVLGLLLVIVAIFIWGRPGSH